MARDGSGSYSLPAGVTASYREVPISSSKWNSAFNDMATELTDSLSRSGKGAMLAALDMGSYKITSVALATTLGDALSYGRNATVADFAATGTFAAKLADGKLWMGNVSGDATAVTISGDITISNAGVAAIATGIIVDADVKSDAAIGHAKLSLAGASVAGTFSAKQFGSAEYDAGNSGTSKTIDCSNGANQKLTLTGNCNGITLTNPVTGLTMKLKVLSGAGSYTCAFTTTVKWPGGSAYVATTSASATDIVTLYYDGASWWGQAANGFA